MKKKFILLCLLLLVVSVPVFAKGTDNFYSGDDLLIEKNIDSTTFMAGRDVEISSEINGASFIAGNNLKLASHQDHIFAAGRNINLESLVTKDAFLAGQTITIETSEIRDLYAAGETIRIDSNIGRNANLAGGTVTINSEIAGDVTVAADTIKIGNEAVITGTLKYPDTANINIAETAQVGNKETYKGVEVEKPSFADVFKTHLTSFLSLLLIGLLLLWKSKTFNKIEKLEQGVDNVFKNVGKGFLFLIALPAGAILLLITVIGIPLSLISLVAYIVLIYLSTIAAAYYLGNTLLKEKVTNKYILLTLSLLGIYILKLIPVVGSLVGFIALCLGLGIFMTLLSKDLIRK
ncbi:MAG: hypothetical protein IJI22_05485 [Bacilli bacterium]|nr:hypothetical protein [Bacilli bacterium]